MFLTREQIDGTAHMSTRAAAKQLGCGATSIRKYRKKYYTGNEVEFLPDAKVLIIDIESKPHLYYSWDAAPKYLGSQMLVEAGGMMCFAAKWLGEDEVEFYSGENAVLEAHRLLSQADLVVTYNGDRYDIKRLNNEFLRAGMAPPKPFRSIDLFKVNKQRFDLPYRKLDYIAQVTGLGEKLKHQGFDLWVDCMAGDVEAWSIMEEYNKQDVKLTEKLYIKLLPWLTNVPHMGMFTAKEGLCPYCAHNILKNSGETTHTFVQEYPLFQCENCEGWSRGTKPVKSSVPTRRAQ